MIKVRLVSGSFAIIDDEDAWVLAYKWREKRGRRMRTSYAVREVAMPNGKRRALYMHREILQNARLPIGRYTDHRDGDGLNNVRRNLRTFNPIQRAAYRKLNSNNKTRFRGVRRQHPNRARSWVATIWFRRKQIHLGTFATARAAALAYDHAAAKAFGEFAFLNFPRRKR